jgi:hypothetical protein
MPRQVMWYKVAEIANERESEAKRRERDVKVSKYGEL